MSFRSEEIQKLPTENNTFHNFLKRIDQDFEDQDLPALAEVITPATPIAYFSMEFYDKDDNDIKGGGGLGVLAADTRRVAEQLDIPFVVVTPFYTEESHQEIVDFKQVERKEKPSPEGLYRRLGEIALSTQSHDTVLLNTYSRELGSTRILTVTEPNFGELYPGGNSGDHRLYQEVALGFAGYELLKDQKLNPLFMQLNEAPTVFAAVARLDDLCRGGMALDRALTEVRQQMLYTNHTLVQAVEGEFELSQFEQLVIPNISSHEVRNWVRGMFSEQGKLKLSSLAIELADTKSGVSELHARISNFKDRYGRPVEFEAVTNGISRKWVLPEIMDYYQEAGVLDSFDLPTENYRDKLDELDPAAIRQLKACGREYMNKVLLNRKDQYGKPISISNDAIVFDFKRRFADYKRPDMIFADTERLARILEEQNAHFVITGKPHPSDQFMKDELTRMLEMIDNNPVLRERVHYVQDYDEEVGQALAIGADCAVNIPVVGQEACGTSWMKDMANFKLLISTPDGGVADRKPIACLEVSGNEVDALYTKMTEVPAIVRDDARYKAMVTYQLKEYMPVISGSRMMAAYLKLFHRLYEESVAVEHEAVA